jgi:hypothetical protein
MRGHGMAGFVYGDASLLVIVQFGFARVAQHDLVIGLGKVAGSDRVSATARGVERGFIDQVGEVGSRKPWRVASDRVEVDVVRQRFVPGVHPQDGSPGRELGAVDQHAAIEAAWP